MLRRSFLASAPVSLIKTFGPFELHAGGSEGCYELFFGSSTNKLNLLDETYFAGLVGVTSYLSSDLNEAARVAIFCSNEGYPFSCGLNLAALARQTARLKESKAMPAMTLQAQHKVIREFQDSVSSLTRCRVPIICAIDGHCIGGSTSLATACDFRFATKAASFTVKEAQVGLAADIGVLQRLPAIVGEGRARELAYSARVFQGDEAKRIGFVEEVFATRAEMLEAARGMASQIARNSPIAVQGTKHLMNYQTERRVQESLDYTRLWSTMNILCDDTVEAASAFAQKRPPKFTNYVVDCLPSAPKT